MSPQEKKELVGYLKKETDRLNKAITKAHETGCFGRVAHHEQMRDAYLSALNTLISKKKIFFWFLLAIPLLFISANQEKDKTLAGKTFIITVSEKFPNEPRPFQCQLAFKDGKLHAKAMEVKSRHVCLPSGFSPGEYCLTVDSSEPAPTVIFSAISKKKNGETLLWLGHVSGNAIEGTMHWSGGANIYQAYDFSGTFKQ